jgi:hypothetical protein
MMVQKYDEDTLVQQTVVAYLKEQLCWKCLMPTTPKLLVI